MGKIEKLTNEQLEQLSAYRQQGIDIGLCTDPINRDAAEDYARRLMKWMRREYKSTIFMDGPISAYVAALMIQSDADQVRDQVGAQVWAHGFIWPYLDGQFFSYWSAWADYFRDVLHLNLTEYWQVKDQTILGMVYPLKEHVIICERPKIISLKNGVLHNDGGPSVYYKDGTSVWSLNGVRVPQWIAETPESEIDPSKFAELKNAEHRREFVRKVGIERIAKHCNAKLLDKQGTYELLSIDLGEDVGRWPYLKMLNPSINTWHMECVDREIKTVQEAIVWRNQSELVPEQLT